MNKKGIKFISAVAIAAIATMNINFAAFAQQNMTVYITDSGGYYHLDGCSEIKKSKIPMLLSDTVGNFDPCPVCNPPSNEDVDVNDMAEETTVAIAEEDLEETEDSNTEVEEDAEESDSNETSNERVSVVSDSSNSSSNGRTTRIIDSEIATPEEEEAFYKAHPEKDKTGKYSSSSSSSNSSSNNSSSSNSNRVTVTSGSNSSNSSGRTTVSSGSGSSRSSSSSSSSNGTELLTQSQRKSRYGSKTNPKEGEKPVTTPRPASNGYMYADFATFNSYDSSNGLGGTPIYILGTVTDVVAFTENTNPATGTKQYRAAIMINDADGYQWYLRAYVSKDKFESLKKDLTGQSGYFYGGYAGYSGVLTRPMMDALTFMSQSGTAINLASYL